jgi:hypothetical protein
VRAAAILEARASFRERLPGWKDQESGTLREQATVLRATGWFGRVFGGAYRRARAGYLALAVGRAAEREEMAERLEELARHTDEVGELAADQVLAELCGPAFRGVETDFVLLGRAHELCRAAASALGGVAGARAVLRRLVLEGPAEAVEALGQVFDESQAAPVESFVRSGLADPAAAAARWREEAGRLRALAGLCERIELPDGLAVEALGRLISELGGLRQEEEEAIARSEAAHAALGPLGAAVLADPQGLEEALALHEAIAALPLWPATVEWILAGDRLVRLAQVGDRRGRWRRRSGARGGAGPRGRYRKVALARVVAGPGRGRRGAVRRDRDVPVVCALP